MEVLQENHLPINILVEGRIDPKSIFLHQTDRAINHNPELNQIIEDTWQKLVKKRPDQYDEPKVLVVRWWHEHDNIHIQTG